MAHIIGKAGEFQEARALNRRRRLIFALFFGMFGFALLMGYVLAKSSLWWLLLALSVTIPAYLSFDRLFTQHLRLARAEENGATGEKDILLHLKQLPDSYTIVSDLSFADSFGNIDHLVIGPTGIFSIDVKNWKGTVSADGNGELLWNGKPTDKLHVKNFTRRTMDLKDRIRSLTKLDPYVQCLFVFPHTRVDANWGTTGAVHCIRAEQIVEYIAKSRPSKSLSAPDLSRIVSAAEALKKLGDDAATART